MGGSAGVGASTTMGTTTGVDPMGTTGTAGVGVGAGVGSDPNSMNAGACVSAGGMGTTTPGATPR
jgi:hypothetical protein